MSIIVVALICGAVGVAYSLITAAWVSKQDHSHRAFPIQQEGVRRLDPEPPRSCCKMWVSSKKIGSSCSVKVPRKMMSPVEPCMFIMPLPRYSQRSHRDLR